MREIGVKELKAGLSEALRAAEGGEPIRVTRHGKPVAELIPPRESAAPEEQVRRLVAAGKMKPAAKPRPAEDPPLYKTERSISDLILAEREAER